MSPVTVVFKMCKMSESICYVLIFGRVVLSGGVSGWYIYFRYVDVFRLVEINLCYLQFGFCLLMYFWACMLCCPLPV